MITGSHHKFFDFYGRAQKIVLDELSSHEHDHLLNSVSSYLHQVSFKADIHQLVSTLKCVVKHIAANIEAGECVQAYHENVYVEFKKMLFEIEQTFSNTAHIRVLHEPKMNLKMNTSPQFEYTKSIKKESALDLLDEFTDRNEHIKCLLSDLSQILYPGKSHYKK